MALFIFTSWGWADTACTGGVSAAPGRGTTNPSFSPRTRCPASVLRLRLPGPGRRGNAGIPPGTLRSQLRASTGEGSTQVDRARGPQQPCDTTPMLPRMPSHGCAGTNPQEPLQITKFPAPKWLWKDQRQSLRTGSKVRLWLSLFLSKPIEFVTMLLLFHALFFCHVGS